MRPAISDSLISGQPLYLLYSYENCGSEALFAPFSAALATQATGRVRLQVTGNPPTINDFSFFSPAQDSKLAGRTAAIAPCRICLRRRKRRDFGFSGFVGIFLGDGGGS